jgi:GNAT superfamily N-acetyltransferase
LYLQREDTTQPKIDMEFRKITFEEIASIWKIDRTEHVEENYLHCSGGLKTTAIHTTFYGWPAEEQTRMMPSFQQSHMEGAFFYGAFDKTDLKGIVLVHQKWLPQNRLQLKYLYVDSSYRGTGIGKKLFNKAKEYAQLRGANSLYISSSESKNTVDFYFHMGCKLSEDIDPFLFKKEPLDIHLELFLGNN